MTNIHDVAKAAGVSVATVSRVLNESSVVTERTRARVLDIIKGSALPAKRAWAKPAFATYGHGACSC